MKRFSFLVSLLIALYYPGLSLMAGQTDPYDPFFDGVDNSAQVNQLQNRVDRLEREILTTQKAVFGKAGDAITNTTVPDAAVAPKMTVEIQKLQEQIQAITGKIEEIEHQLKMMPAVPDTTSTPPANPTNITPNTPPTNNLASTAATSATVAAAATTTPSKDSSTDSQLSVQQQFQAAFEFVKKSDFPNAQTALTQFINDNKTSPLLSNAYFWLGEIYFIQKKFEDAAVQYLKGYKAMPRGAKAAESLYKLTLALEKLQNKTQACKTLDRLNQEFPDMAKSLRFKVQDAIKQIGCSANPL